MLLTNYKSVDSPLPQLEWKCAWARRQQTSAAGLGQTKNQKQQHQEHAQNGLAVCPPSCLDRARKNDSVAIVVPNFGAFFAPNWTQFWSPNWYPVLAPHKLGGQNWPPMWRQSWPPMWANTCPQFGTKTRFQLRTRAGTSLGLGTPQARQESATSLV